MAGWEAGINEFQELLAHIGFHRLAERRVEPSDAAAPGVPPGSCLLLRLVLQLVGVPAPPQGLLVRALGCIKQLLGGGEFGQPLVDPRGDAPGGGGRVVGVDVDVQWEVVGLHEGLVGVAVQVEGDIQDVHHLQVGFRRDLEPVLAEDGGDLLLQLLHLPGAEVADGQPVVPVQPGLQGQVLQLGQEEQAHQIAGFSSVIAPHTDIKVFVTFLYPSVLSIMQQRLLGVHEEVLVLAGDVHDGARPVQRPRQQVLRDPRVVTNDVKLDEL